MYTADFDNETHTVKPLLASTFDEIGIYRKDLHAVYPPIYRKNKDNVIIVE